MSRNGSGTYSLPAGNPVVTGTTISSTWANNSLSDIATALTGSLAADGQTTPTANLPMGGFKLTGMGLGTSATDSIRLGQAQAAAFSLLASVTGVDTITAAGSPTVTAYAAGQSFRFVSAGANTGAATINIDSLGAKSITKNGSTALSAGDIPSGALVQVVYDGTRFQLSGTLPVVTTSTVTVPRLLQNVSLAVSLSGNAATIALKDASGADPSASSAAVIGFRNATLTTGTASQVSVTAATSTVISSGSTGGTTSAVPSRIWIGAILNAGAVELAWFNALSGTNIAPINEGGLITTTAEGGAGAADSAQVWYSTTARSNVPVTIIGYFDSTQATAGTWATSVTSIVVNPRYRPGDIIQTAVTQTGALSSGSGTFNYNDNIPQNTDGQQVMSQAITPTAAANVLDISAQVIGSTSTGNASVAALYQDSVANALKVARTVQGADSINIITLRHIMVAATTSATTMKARAGSDTAATYAFNGVASTPARRFGGVADSYLTINEVVA